MSCSAAMLRAGLAAALAGGLAAVLLVAGIAAFHVWKAAGKGT